MLTSAASNGTMTTIAGMLISTPNSFFRVEFFASNACHPSGFGEGQTFLGAAMVTTDSNCVADFTGGNGLSLPVAVAAGQVITATATDSAGNTSEFSQCVPVIVVTSNTNTAANPDTKPDANTNSNSNTNTNTSSHSNSHSNTEPDAG